MFEAKELSRIIRDKKKKRLAPDMDNAGQEGLPPEQALAADLNAKVNETLDNPDHEPANETEMGEGESSQSKASLKRAMGIVNKFFHEMMIKG